MTGIVKSIQLDDIDDIDDTSVGTTRVAVQGTHTGRKAHTKTLSESFKKALIKAKKEKFYLGLTNKWMFM